jgi:NAD(P)H-dependent flavin oxidoreductase YrpB (nitropropane dioxygenase family)
MLQTALTRGLKITYPILSAGMARVSQAPLVAAVSEAGGLGCLGGVSYLPDELRAEIRTIRERTAKPFAVDLVLPEVLLADDDADEWGDVRRLWAALSPHQRTKLRGVEPMLVPGAVQGQIEVILEERPPVLALTFDASRWIVDACHERDIKTIALCGSVRRAVAADAAGVDYVVAQGMEGGGHTGYIGTLALVPSVVDAISVPVIAAGGITDGRGMAAALCLGAAGVWCGTRFIASREAFGHRGYKECIVAAEARDTTLTKGYTGKNLRVLRNSWTERWEQGDDTPRDFSAQYAVAAERVETGYQDGEADEGMMPVGQGVGLVRNIAPAGEIVREMAADAERILELLASGATSNV